MNPIDRALVQKEWSEHSRKIAALSLILLGICAAALPFGVSALLDVFYLFVALYYPILGGTFLAMRIVAGERADGTDGFIDSLPVSPRRYALIRLLMGALSCCVPIAAAGLFVVACVAVGPSLPGDAMARGVMTRVMGALDASEAAATAVVAGISTLSTFSVYVWTGVFGLGAASENAAGARAVVVLFIAAMIALVTYVIPGDPAVWNAPGPAGGLALLELLKNYQPEQNVTWGTLRGDMLLFLKLSLAFAAHVAVLTYLVRHWIRHYPSFSAEAVGWETQLWNRFLARRKSVRSVEQFKHKPANHPYRIARRSIHTALAWKQSRESLPTGLVALGISMMIGLLSGDSTRLAAEGFLVVGWMMALVMGTAAFLSDVDFRASLFWRSGSADDLVLEPVSRHSDDI